jgi:hypothetical protein
MSKIFNSKMFIHFFCLLCCDLTLSWILLSAYCIYFISIALVFPVVGFGKIQWILDRNKVQTMLFSWIFRFLAYALIKITGNEAIISGNSLVLALIHAYICVYIYIYIYGYIEISIYIRLLWYLYIPSISIFIWKKHSFSI